MKSNNIQNLADCYGCGVCAITCPQKIIGIDLDKNGFYQPVILNSNKCTRCGLCLSVCAYAHNELAFTEMGKIDGYAAWSNNDVIRYKCSSGGIAFELGRYLITQGYKACGVKYNVEQNRAEHFIADNELDFQDSIGSKYLQSFTLNAFNQFKKEEKYFVTGTPCQIDSLRRYINLKGVEDNFVLLDFFCHGVPSMLMWKKYVKYIQNEIGELSQISWRDKKNGWFNSYTISAQSKEPDRKWVSRLGDGDEFFKLFLNDSCLGNACYSNCKYKRNRSSADVRVGDFWGTKFKGNVEGVSCVLVFTKTGKSFINQLDDCTLASEKIDVVMDGQIIKPLKKKIAFYLIIFLLKTQLSLCQIHKVSCLTKKIMNFNNRIKSKIYRLFSKCL